MWMCACSECACLCVCVCVFVHVCEFADCSKSVYINMCALNR